MKYFIFLLFLSFTVHVFAQNSSATKYSKHFYKDNLNAWMKTFVNFKLHDFKVKDTQAFLNNAEQDLNTIKEFLAIYKPLISYSKDSSCFIDIYSKQLNLEQKGKYYEATVEPDQNILLCNFNTKYWNSIAFSGSTQWIEELHWISQTEFILVGINNNDGIKYPRIIIGNLEKQSLIEYENKNKLCVQTKKGYSSAKLKKLKIKGL